MKLHLPTSLSKSISLTIENFKIKQNMTHVYNRIFIMHSKKLSRDIYYMYVCLNTLCEVKISNYKRFHIVSGTGNEAVVWSIV